MCVTCRGYGVVITSVDVHVQALFCPSKNLHVCDNLCRYGAGGEGELTIFTIQTK